MHSGSNGILFSINKFDGSQSDLYGFAQAALGTRMFPQLVVISMSVKMQTKLRLLPWHSSVCISMFVYYGNFTLCLLIPRETYHSINISKEKSSKPAEVCFWMKLPKAQPGEEQIPEGLSSLSSYRGAGWCRMEHRQSARAAPGLTCKKSKQPGRFSHSASQCLWKVTPNLVFHVSPTKVDWKPLLN